MHCSRRYIVSGASSFSLHVREQSGEQNEFRRRKIRETDLPRGPFRSLGTHELGNERAPPHTGAHGYGRSCVFYSFVISLLGPSFLSFFLFISRCPFSRMLCQPNIQSKIRLLLAGQFLCEVAVAATHFLLQRPNHAAYAGLLLQTASSSIAVACELIT